MKAVVYDAPGSFTITEVPTPDPGPGEVRVRVRQTGICGTDLHIHNGKFFAEFPLTPGHELVGPVDALGEGTEGFRVGEYVAVNPNLTCGHCEYCRAAALDVRQPQGNGHQLAGVVRRVRRGSRRPGLLRRRHRPRHVRVHRAHRVRHARRGNPESAAGELGPGLRRRPHGAAPVPAHRARRRGQRDGRGFVGVQAQAGRGTRDRHHLPDGSRRSGRRRRQAEGRIAAVSTSSSTPPGRRPCRSNACR